MKDLLAFPISLVALQIYVVLSSIAYSSFEMLNECLVIVIFSFGLLCLHWPRLLGHFANSSNDKSLTDLYHVMSG